MTLTYSDTTYPDTIEAPTATPVALDIRPLSGTIGAEIRGVDLKQPLDHETSPRSAPVWSTYKVVFFPGQHLSPDEHRAFTAQFGELTAAPSRSSPASRDTPRCSRSTTPRPRELYASYGDLTRKRSQASAGTPTSPSSSGRRPGSMLNAVDHSAVGRRHPVVQPGRRVRGAEPGAPGLPVDAHRGARRWRPVR